MLVEEGLHLVENEEGKWTRVVVVHSNRLRDEFGLDKKEGWYSTQERDPYNLIGPHETPNESLLAIAAMVQGNKNASLDRDAIAVNGQELEQILSLGLTGNDVHQLKSNNPGNSTLH